LVPYKFNMPGAQTQKTTFGTLTWGSGSDSYAVIPLCGFSEERI
jgi:hypothetical protein